MSLSDMVFMLHCSTLYDHCSLIFVFFVFRICIALHSCISFYVVFFFFFFFLKKKEANCVLHLFSWHWKQGFSIYLHITCLCILFSLDKLIYYTLLVKLCSACCVGKMLIVFDHFVLILKSHIFNCRTWTFEERHK